MTAAGETLAGRTALVSGGGAAGLRIARELARRGARVILADTGARDAGPGIELHRVAAGDLAALRSFAAEVCREGPPVHRLLLLGPWLDGHYALVALLFERLLAAGAPRPQDAARVVTAARLSPLGPTRQGHLAFARALHDRLKEAGMSRQIASVAALGSPAVLLAALQPDLRSGQCLAPSGLAARLGPPTARPLARRRADTRLWEEAGRRTGASFERIEQEVEALGQTRRALLEGPRRISAMVRVKNEEEFLYPAVESIVDLVDEVVLIDNRSSDKSPEIIRQLAARHPAKVKTFAYPHECARQGGDNWLATEGSGAHPLHEYANWCLERCGEPFVLRWDADMIALDAFGAWLERWRASDRLVLAFFGANVHPDRRHLLAARSSDRAQLEAKLARPGLPEWAVSLTYDSTEARLLPRWGSSFQPTWGWVETHESPFLRGEERARSRLECDEPCFLHMKFCKARPLANYTDDLARAIEENIVEGPALSAAQLAALARFNPAEPGRSAGRR